MDERIPAAVSTLPEPSIETKLETATYLLGKYLWIEEGQIVATYLWEDEALLTETYEKHLAAAEALIRDRSVCRNGCEVNRENVVHEDGFCDGCHEYPEG